MTIVEALKKFYEGNAHNEDDLKEADSVLDAIRAKYGPYEGTNIAEYLQTAMANGVTPGSGGGGGDFNTAEVTVKGMNGENSFYLDIYKDDTGNFPAIFCTEDHFSDSAYTTDGTPTTYTLMYTGDSVTIAVGNAYTSSTGDVVYNEDDNTVTISGDCSVTGWIED